MGKKRGGGGFVKERSSPVKTSSRGFVTIGSFIKPQSEKQCKDTLDKVDGKLQPADTGRLWKITYEKVDECVYHLTLVEPQPLIVICADADVATLAATLKCLYTPHESSNAVQVTSITMKSQRAQAQKIFRKTILRDRGLIVVSAECAMMAKSCLPTGTFCKTIVHVGGIPSASELLRRTQLSKPETLPVNANHIYLVNRQEMGTIESRVCTYETRKNWMPVMQARCAAARKLVSTLQAASSFWNNADKDLRRLDMDVADDVDSEQKKAAAGRVDALRLRLKVTMGMTLPGELSESISAATISSNVDTFVGGSKGGQTTDSNRVRRTKMEILGMVHVPSEEERLAQASTGRTLAATRWLDRTPAISLCPPCGDAPVTVGWSCVRLGASMDSAAAQARIIVEGFREFVAHRAQRRVLKRHQERDLMSDLPENIQKQLESSRITALGWRPSPFGEGEWGGKYGKSCAHNEVSMFYLRPFAPMEVLNTHVCSKSSPAPGNEGHDGCLEFLMAQCAFFQRPMHVWDDRYFHFINTNGAVQSTEKLLLLSRSEQHLRWLMENIRQWILLMSRRPDHITCPVTTIIDTIDLIAGIGCGTVRIAAARSTAAPPPRAQRLIAAFAVGKYTLK